MTSLDAVVFSPLVPWWLIAALAAVGAVILGGALWRGANGLIWRGLAIAAVLGALSNPALVAEEREGRPDIVVVVADRSQSQTIGERTAATDAALATLTERLAALDDLEVRLVEAGQVTETAGEDDGTLLFGALTQALSDVPPDQVAGAIFITDGQIHDAPGTLAQMALSAPLHVLLTGTHDAADRRLVIDNAPTYGIVGDQLSVTLQVVDSGAAPSGGTPRLARVALRFDGGAPSVHSVPVGVPQTIPFTLDHGGVTVIELEVAEGPAELTLQNNRAAIGVSGVRERLRVLLVSGQPHAGERTWRNLLKADPSVDLVHFTILRPPEKQDGTSVRELSLIAFPTRELFEVKLDEFDLIIFDRYRRRGVLLPTYVRNIAQYVLDGGALLEAAGPEFASPLSLFRTPLGRVLPAAPTGAVFNEGFRPGLTEVGRRHPVTANLPGAHAPGEEPDWGRWFRQIDTDLISGNALLSGVSNRPLLVLDRVGEGRVAQLLSDHAWLWARGFEGGGPQAELLRRVAHWLMKEPDLEEEELRAAAAGNTIHIERRSLEPGGLPVILTSPAGEEIELILDDGGDGRATTTVLAQETGLYRLSDGTHTTVAAVGVLNSLEFADVRTTDERLDSLIQASGGRAVWLVEETTPSVRRVRRGRNASGRGWIGLVANESYFVTGVRQSALLPPLAVLLLVLGGLMLAWRREGR